MAFEKELIASMNNGEAARAWRMARHCNEVGFLNLKAVIAACEKNNELDRENENLAVMVGRLSGAVTEERRCRCFLVQVVSTICGIAAIDLWAVALAVLQ